MKDKVSIDIELSIIEGCIALLKKVTNKQSARITDYLFKRFNHEVPKEWQAVYKWGNQDHEA